MTEPGEPSSLKELDARLRAARERQDRTSGGNRKEQVKSSGVGLGFRLAVELIAGLAVGVGLGLLLDHWLGTSPLLLIVFFFLGAAAGFLNVYRIASGQGYAVGYRGDKTEGSSDKGPGERG